MRAPSLLAIITALTMGVVGFSEPSNDTDWYTLTSLWKEYEEAVSNDRPLRQMEVLSRIKSLAREERLSWDFYQAGIRYVAAGASINWKQLDTLKKAWGAEVASFDEPIVSFECAKSLRDKKELVDSAEVRLRAAHNESFYHCTAPVSTQMGGALSSYISSDYEYALWSLMLGGESSGHDRLEALLEGSYPGGAWLEYYDASHIAAVNGDFSARKEAMEAFCRKYSQRGVCYYARRDLLSMKKDSLHEAGAGSDSYRLLLNECEAFLAELAKLGNTEEVTIAAGAKSRVESLIAELNRKSLSIEADENSITVIFRNLGYADVSVYKEDGEEPLHTLIVENPTMSFYLRDTVSTPLPLLDDGSYLIRASCNPDGEGDISDEIPFLSYTLSIATRLNAGGRGVYVADYKSGEPLPSITLVLRKGDKELVSVGDFPLGQGFTNLPPEIVSAISDKGSYYLQASQHDGKRLRLGENLGIRGGAAAAAGTRAEEMEQGRLFMDRGAYNPGDTAFVKAVFYALPDVLPEGEMVTLSLYDSQDNEIAKEECLTDEFGSVATKFGIPEGLRGGRFSVRATHGSASQRRYFTVDEFVLPTFGLTFNPISEFYLPGDIVPLSGNIYSYSGHSLGSAKVTYKIISRSALLGEGALVPDEEGNFTVLIPSDSSRTTQSFMVTVTVSDGTGETEEFSKFVGISSSVSMSLTHENPAEGEAALGKECEWTGGVSLIAGDNGLFTATVKNRSGQAVPSEVTWVLLSSCGEATALGSTQSGEEFEIDFSAFPSGLYRLEAGVSLRNSRSDRPIEASKAINILLLRPSDTTLNPHIDHPKRAGQDPAPTLNARIDHLFLPGDEEVEPGSSFGLRLGSGTGQIWAVTELYGEASELLDSRTVYLPGESGSSSPDCSLTDVLFEYKAEYPDAVKLQLFYFRDGTLESYSRSFRRLRRDLDLPLEFSSFEDRTAPGKGYTIGIKTRPGVQCLAAIFDKASERISSNKWSGVKLLQPSVPEVSISSACGNVGGIGKERPVLFMTRSASLEEEVTSMMVLNPESMSSLDVAEEEETLRSDFAATLCFEPFLQSDENGDISLSFSTSDMLSTYFVSLFAHDKSMRNAVLRREMVVTLPIKLAISEPQFLYVGDRWSPSVTVSSTLEEAISGTLEFYQDGIMVATTPAVIPARGAEAFSFEVSIPSVAGSVEVKAIFRSPLYSDGVAVSVPVLPAMQSLSEAHSAVLRSHSDKEALLQELKEAFVNVTPEGAELREVSLLDMVREALPAKVEPSSDNVLSLAGALYVRVVAHHLGADIPCEMPDSVLLARIAACQNSDGGFAWFEGMGSSPIITATVMEGFGKLLEHYRVGMEPALLADSCFSAAVRYIDSVAISGSRPLWCGGLSTAHYLYVRSLWPSVPFESTLDGLADFQKTIQDYLLPSGKRGLNGELFLKTYRLATLRNLAASSQGLALAKAWGIGSKKRLTKSLEADIISLMEYAVEHKHGGIYYPNLETRRGLLESEAFMHAMLSELMADYSPDIADGIRLWLMLQKETQRWDSDPAFVDAISAILSASDEVLATKVICLEQHYEKPFEEISATGNGFTVKREFYRDGSASGVKSHNEPVEPGTVLHKGDKITAVYTVWNEENRSFVRLHAPREATLRPLHQLSGSFGRSATSAYREVKANSSEYYFEVLPEETSVFSEEFHVTQDGVFSAPVLSIECLYSPQYLANDSFNGLMKVGE